MSVAFTIEATLVNLEYFMAQILMTSMISCRLIWWLWESLLLIWMLSIMDFEILDIYLFISSNIHCLYLITQILFVNIGVWWYNWRQKGLHVLQAGFLSCSACHWPHNWSENAFLVWNGSNWSIAGGMRYGDAYSCIFGA